MAAPSGGGGGGGPVGFTGGIASIGQGLNYIGDHCYAYSGEIGVTNAGHTMLDFQTGHNQYIIADIQLSSKGGSGNDFYVDIKLNGTVVHSNIILADSAEFAGQAISSPLTVVIPGDSTFSLSIDNDQATTRIWTVTLVGRVYT
jgi:hypothetical protein